MLSDLEEIRLRNLQLSRNLLRRDTHFSDEELSVLFFQISEDLVKMSFAIKRLINPFD